MKLSRIKVKTAERIKKISENVKKQQ